MQRVRASVCAHAHTNSSHTHQPPCRSKKLGRHFPCPNEFLTQETSANHKSAEIPHFILPCKYTCNLVKTPVIVSKTWQLCAYKYRKIDGHHKTHQMMTVTTSETTIACRNWYSNGPALLLHPAASRHVKLPPTWVLHPITSLHLPYPKTDEPVRCITKCQVQKQPLFTLACYTAVAVILSR